MNKIQLSETKAQIDKAIEAHPRFAEALEQCPTRQARRSLKRKIGKKVLQQVQKQKSEKKIK